MERQLCDSQDSSHPSQTGSRNAAQNASQTILHNVPEASAETGRSLSVPHNIYALQPSSGLAQGESTRPQMNISSAVSVQVGFIVLSYALCIYSASKALVVGFW